MEVRIWMDAQNLKSEGLGITAIADRLGVSRPTARKLVNATKEQVEAPRRRPTRKSKAAAYAKHIEARLELFPEIYSETLFDELRKLGYKGSARAVRRYLGRIRGESRPGAARTYRRFETAPGEQAQCDWGHVGKIVIHGKTLNLYVFVMVLGYSRMRFVKFAVSQSMSTFLQCHQAAFEYFGGVPRQIVYDNAKTVVVDRVGTAIAFNRDMLLFAGFHGFKAAACWAQSPESKGKVERVVGYVKNSFYSTCEYDGLDDLNGKALAWSDVVNAKEHGTTGVPPVNRMAEELSSLLPLPGVPFGVEHVEMRYVNKDLLLHFEGNQYSAPARLARKKAVLRVSDAEIEVLDAVTHEVVATHARCWGTRQLVIDEAHYPRPEDKPTELKTRRNGLQARFEGLCEAAAAYLKGLANTGCANLSDHTTKITRLAIGYSQQQLHAAMTRAIHFEAYGYPTLKAILEKGLYEFDLAAGHPVTSLTLEEVLGSLPDTDVQRRSLSEYGRYAH